LSEAPEKTETERPASTPAGKRFAALIARSRHALLWEQLWPPVAATLVVLGLFLAASWAGLWISIPPLARIFGVAVFGLLFAASLSPFLWLKPPRRAEALSRLDRESGIAHRPATAIDDRLANGSSDPVMDALWRAHRSAAERNEKRIRTPWPAPRLAWRDPYAIRALVLLSVIATFFVASGDHLRRIAAAFDFSGIIAPKIYRVDAWVTPPSYTGRAPLLLPGIRHDQPPPKESAAFTVPAGSELVVRATGLSALDLAPQGGLAEQKAEGQPNSSERHFRIGASGSLTVKGLPGGAIVWPFNAVPDPPPKISFTQEPETSGRGTLTLNYKLEDDYGVASAEARISALPPEPGMLAPRALVPPPEFPLTLPQAHTRAGNGQTSRDISDHPWAGAIVNLQLAARDDAGSEGLSDTREVQLPERNFTKELALALVEQRRVLAQDANARDKVMLALVALMIAPDRFTADSGIYLGLRTAFARLRFAKNDADLVSLLDYLWEMALQIEDGDLSDVDRELKAAQDALREALQRGASDEEIKRLMDNLRAALDKFMQALTEQLRRQDHAGDRPLDRNARVVRPQDLKNMLDRMENLAKSGNRDAARKMLDDMQAMLDSLSRSKQAQGNPEGEGNDPLDELGRMIQEQQRLRDKTYRQGRQQDGRQQNGQQNGQQGERNRRAYGDLKGNQQELRQKLEQMLEALKRQGQRNGGQPGQEENGEGSRGEAEKQANDALGRAGKAMEDAEGALEGGDSEGAVDAQGRALQALRKGAQSLADAMQGEGEGQGQPGGQQSGSTERTDPLGRPMRSREYGEDYTVKIPGEIDVQRARRVLEELRRRFSEPDRPREELDYLERLLRDF
jgi:uncharacterized protein (TIGR02302 family)